MRMLVLVALGMLSGCATLTPREIANNRRDLIARQVGCAPIDVTVKVVPEVEYDRPWLASCGDKNYVCTGDSNGWPPQFVVSCQYR